MRSNARQELLNGRTGGHRQSGITIITIITIFFFSTVLFAVKISTGIIPIDEFSTNAGSAQACQVLVDAGSATGSNPATFIRNQRAPIFAWDGLW